MKYTAIVAFTLLATLSASADDALRLSYDEPAEIWEEALPVGNGRLGAMVFGGVAEERIQFNEDTLWTGIPRSYANEGARNYLGEIRQLLRDGRQSEAEDLAMREFMSEPLGQEAYQPFGDILLRFPGHGGATDYERALDLDRAEATTRYTMDGVTYTRTVFASHPDNVLVLRITADKPGALDFDAALSTPHATHWIDPRGDSAIELRGAVSPYIHPRTSEVRPSAITFAAQLRAQADGGTVTVADSGIHVRGANAATLLLTGATNYVNYQDLTGDPRAKSTASLERAAAKDFATLESAHLEDHRALFRRVSIDLGGVESNTTTDLRLRNFNDDADPGLAELYFQYGRYLLIASSRPGSQPANLQGIWNDSMTPSWDSKYTVNINTEMNYWPAEVTNLSECTTPLFAMLEDLSQTGAEVARKHYGAEGWVLHHNTDLWRGAAPINHANHGIWPTGGAWLSTHLWEHYLYSGDKDFLRETAYPLLKGASQFFLDQLTEDPRSGFLISTPSNSPENGGLVAGPTMDHQIITDLFAYTAEAASLLGVDATFRDKLDTTRARIAPMKIGRLGQLQEWIEDVDEESNKHRHVSHLYGLYPSALITPEKTPELYDAARKSLEMRGDEGTGWSLGWKISLWARLRDGDHAHILLKNQLRPEGMRTENYSGRGGSYPNLFDAHPPFQIDGNFGGTAGIAEMLMQSHQGEIHLLPALPSNWPQGSVTGLRARGGYTVDATWEDGRLTRAKITSSMDGPCTLRIGETRVTLNTEAGQSYTLDGALQPAG